MQFPLYQKLAKDEIWGVCLACVQNLSKLGSPLPSHLRAQRLQPCVDAFSGDVSRWVRQGTLQSLGPLIATFGRGEVPGALLDRFMTVVLREDKDVDDDSLVACAAAFPRVVAVTGPEQWPRLLPGFQSITRHVQVLLLCGSWECIQIPALVESAARSCRRSARPGEVSWKRRRSRDRSAAYL